MTALWGIGQYRCGTRSVPFAVARAELERDVEWAREAFARLRLGRGSRVLVVSRLSEAAQYWPFQAALVGTGAIISCAEAARFDAFRTAMFLRRLRYDAVVGIDGEVLDGLRDVEVDPSVIFRGVRVLGARAEALAPLREYALEVVPWLHVGPAIAVGCASGAGAHLDGEEWHVSEQGGEIVIGSRRPRATKVERERTGVYARIDGGACGCGARGPTIRLAPEGVTS